MRRIAWLWCVVVLVGCLLGISLTRSRIVAVYSNGPPCVDWVVYRAHQLTWEPGIQADAYQWILYALATGHVLGTDPVPLSIAVWEKECEDANPDLGHVAFVESVNTDGTFNITEFNWPTENCSSWSRDDPCERPNVNNADCIWFIHNPVRPGGPELASHVEVSEYDVHPGLTEAEIQFSVLNTDPDETLDPSFWIVGGGIGEWGLWWVSSNADFVTCDGCDDPIPPGETGTISFHINLEGWFSNSRWDGAYDVEYIRFEDWGGRYQLNNSGNYTLGQCFNVCYNCLQGTQSTQRIEALESGNCPDYCGGAPAPTPQPTLTPTPTPTSEPPPDRSQCQDESKTGVYLYKDTNYEGSCAFFVDDHPNLGDTPVGDNGASSIRINGEYSVKLYRDINYGEPYEEVNESEADLGWRSLGNQFSSIKLHETQHCSDEGLPGVYLYSGRNYGGDCAYFVANHPNLGETPVGDNATASIRINGEYTAWLYQDTDYGGVYDEIGASEPDLSWRSLYGQYSSIKLSVLQHCSDETQPGIYLYSSANYGGSCKYYIEDCPDLDLMPVSIRLVGPFWARIYGETNYQGPYEEFNESEPSMDWRSLGRNWHSMEVMVDATPPDTSITSGPSGVIPIGSATFTWTGSDDRTSTAELEYRWRLLGLSNDWASWSHGTSVTYNDLADAYYTFGVKARDVAHNEDPSPANQSFFVDTTPPDTTITTGPSGCIGTADVTFTWTGSDNRTPTAELLYSCKLEGFNDWLAWTGDTSKSYTDLPDGDYTFKVKAQDGVGHEDALPAARPFRVDTTPPTGSVLVNGGDSTTNKITVYLDITGDDGPVGCGVTEMRLSNDGHNWEAWQPFATEGEWLLPTLNRTTWTVHLQLKDLVGNVSDAFTDDIYLDLYPPRPASESYQLGARVVASADPTSESESYGLLSATMGQPIADGRMQGADYRLESGYQGAWPSVPRGRPTPESYDINPSVMASADGYQESESYCLWGTAGQPVDYDQPSSENYQLLSGYWGMQPPLCRLFGDLNGDRKVDADDIQQVASRWRMTDVDPNWEKRYDLNVDGVINIVDLMLVSAHWGETCE